MGERFYAAGAAAGAGNHCHHHIVAAASYSWDKAGSPKGGV